MHYLRRWRYYLDFAVMPPLAAGLTLYDCRSVAWVALALLGVLAFTFGEYITHRWFYHGALWHSIHENHHRNPRDLSEGVWWYGPAGLAAIYFAVPTSFFVGVTLAYFWMGFAHHLIHHYSWPMAATIRHNRHHKRRDVNYGITVPLWDNVFGTRA